MVIITIGLCFILGTFLLYNWLKDKDENFLNPLRNVVYIVIREMKDKSGFENLPIKGIVQSIKELKFYTNFEILQFFTFLQLSYLSIMLITCLIAPKTILSSISKYFFYIYAIGLIYFIYTMTMLILKRRSELKNEKAFAIGFALVFTIAYFSIYEYFGYLDVFIITLKKLSTESLSYLNLWLKNPIKLIDYKNHIIGTIWLISFLLTFFKFSSLIKVLRTIRVINQNLENESEARNVQINQILKKYKIIFRCFYAYIISNTLLFLNQKYLFNGDWIFLAHGIISTVFYLFISEEELNINARESAQLSLSLQTSLDKQSSKSTKKSGKLREAYEYTKISTNQMFLNSVADAINVYIIPLIYLFMLSAALLPMTHMSLCKSLDYNKLYSQRKDYKLFKDVLLLYNQSSIKEKEYIQDFYVKIDIRNDMFTESNIKFISAIIDVFKSILPYCIKHVYLNMVVFETIAYICLLIFISNIKE